MRIRIDFRVLVLALAVILAAPAARAQSSGGEWSAITSISALYPTSQKMIFITEFSESEWSSCASGRRFALDPDNADYPAQVAALLTAFAGGRDIQMFIRPDQSLPTCDPIVDRFFVFD